VILSAKRLPPKTRHKNLGLLWETHRAHDLPPNFSMDARMSLQSITSSCALLWLPVIALAGNGSWTTNGPEGITGSKIAVSADNANIVYLAGRGGLYKSTNSGTSWARTNLREGWASDVWVNPTNANEVRVVNFDAVLRSTNGGNSWTRLTGTGLPANRSLSRIAVSPSAPNTFLVFDQANGLFRTTNGGSSYTAVPMPPTISFTFRLDGSIAFDPNTPGNVLWMVCNENFTGASIYRSTDAGVSFSAVTAGPLGCDSDTSISFANTSGRVNVLGWRSTDGGASFNTYSSTGLTGIGRYAGKYRRGTNEFYQIIGQEAYLSLDFGSSFTSFGSGMSENGIDGAGIEDFAFKPGVNQVYAVAGNGSFFKSGVGASAFTASNTTLIGTNMRAVVVHPNNPNFLYGGWGDVFSEGQTPAFYRSTNRGGSWVRSSAGLGLDEVRVIALDRNTAAAPATTHLYAGGSDTGPFRPVATDVQSSIARSTDGGATWTHFPLANFTPTLANFRDMGKVRGIAFDPSSGATATSPLQRFYFTARGAVRCIGATGATVAQTLSGPRLWKTNNAGAAFTGVDTLPTGTCTVGTNRGSYPVPVPILTVPGTPSTLYIGTFLTIATDGTAASSTVQNGVFKSIDAGVTWTHSSSGLPRYDAANPASSHKDVLALAIDPSNPNTIYATVNDLANSANSTVYKSTNAGATWAPAGTGLVGSDIRALLHDPNVPNQIYAASGSSSAGPGGVFVSGNGGTLWTSTSIGLPVSSATALAIDRSGADPILYAGTSSGIYDITRVADLDSDGPPDTTEASAFNNGDGNEDGIADNNQANVASIGGTTNVSANNPNEIKRGSATANVTISVVPLQGACNQVLDASSASAETLGPVDPSYSYPLGSVVIELPNCQRAIVSVRYVGQQFSPQFKFRNFGPTVLSDTTTLEWRDTPNSGFTGNTWTFLVEDNTPGDNRAEVGRILFLGGPGTETYFKNGFED
jgi:hypothetical protein